jgi:DNA modification methylase
MHHRGNEVKTGIARVTDAFWAPVSGTDRYPTGDFHPAQRPPALYAWLIELLCPPNGLVLDPFMGHGTTAVAARITGRGYVGFETRDDYVQMANQRLARLTQRDHRQTRTASKGPVSGVIF